MEQQDIKAEIRRRRPNIFQHLNKRENILFQGLSPEKAKEQFEKAKKELERIKKVIESDELANLKRQSITKLFENAKRKLDQAEEALSNQKFGEAFGLSTAVIHKVGSIRQQLRTIKFREESKKRWEMLRIRKRKEQTQNQPREETPKEGEEARHPKKENCVCFARFNPVCGVDGKTYTNACRAECEGVEIAHKGKCEKKPSRKPDTNEVSSESNAEKEKEEEEEGKVEPTTPELNHEPTDNSTTNE
jgi:hypothetical protein